MEKLLFLVLILSGCSIGTYEDLTAEEWADEYQYCSLDLLDAEYALDDIKDCIFGVDYLEDAYECLNDY